ncbi:hypothetical protein LSM04_008693 [Trypanosoma melophagium]|uniref:uncharacterized protein n=1 Tax=Trypanosoma melophagium TaxID=715481 RepID=UPI00351A4B35|nr:hypothetical protein LSM04_008693 [Trypanosoma melophagium]
MSAVHAVSTSAGGRFLLLGCTDGIKGYEISSSGILRKLIPTVGEAAARRSCHPVGGSVSVVAVLAETPLIAFVLNGGVPTNTNTTTNSTNTNTNTMNSSNSTINSNNSEVPELSAATSRVLHLYDLSAAAVLAELHFPTAVLAARMNGGRLVVAREECLHVLDLPGLAPLAELRTTAPRNPAGLIALSDRTTNTRGEAVSYVAFPQSDSGHGDVWVAQIKETHNTRDGHAAVERVAIVRAHQRAVVCLAMTPDGTRIATASAFGTTVKVFEPSTARLLYHFRRGIAQARMLSLSFDTSSDVTGLRLAALSSKGTLHVFRCSAAGGNKLETPALVETSASDTTAAAAKAATSAKERSFAQAAVGPIFAPATSASPWTAVEHRKGTELQHCFFSHNGRFVWVLVPSLSSIVKDYGFNAEDNDYGGNFLLANETDVANTPIWVLRQYAVHIRGCELIKVHLLN